MKNLNESFDSVFPPDVPVVFLHAHPDDESFLSAGILQELASRKRETIIVYAAAAIVDGADKMLIRHNEAAQACRLLGIDRILYLPFCEPKYEGMVGANPLAGAHLDDATRRLHEYIQEGRPQKPFVLVSYDENGGYGNRDHIVVHELGQSYAKKYPDRVSRSLEITLDREGVRSWLDAARSRLEEESLPKLSYWSPIFGSASEDISYAYELPSAQLNLKRRALAAHESQVRHGEFPLSLSKEDFQEFFGREYLRE